LWVKEKKPLKAIPMGIKAGIPLMHQPMDPIHKELGPLLHCSHDIYAWYKSVALNGFLRGQNTQKLHSDGFGLYVGWSNTDQHILDSAGCSVGISYVALPVLAFPLSFVPYPPLLFSPFPRLTGLCLESVASWLLEDLGSICGAVHIFRLLIHFCTRFGLEYSMHNASGLGKVSCWFSFCYFYLLSCSFVVFLCLLLLRVYLRVALYWFILFYMPPCTQAFSNLIRMDLCGSRAFSFFCVQLPQGVRISLFPLVFSGSYLGGM
jgi:hypothetical protein